LNFIFNSFSPNNIKKTSDILIKKASQLLRVNEKISATTERIKPIPKKTFLSFESELIKKAI